MVIAPSAGSSWLVGEVGGRAGRRAVHGSWLHGDRTDVRNYRPLTMLNSDYKVYTKVLANRLKTVVHQFVTEAQKGFVPDVFIAECSMLLNLIVN